ncbi:tripartite tricarboxylate transporter TctB family protein [Paenibacillus naphthalenovorans]|uniref:Tripartite tricarboxylate transporter family receptor n=2 Tax=Paenibacillus TaxID=44249 RepID=A0A0U2W161_9BACL|nr:tripartite tricarboxylate transporter TctB family protein [Paenibacillus naphthalenovorans]ALS21117.1 tripartite tricarboxylate transporter family receptor [Paenibacillus naphthalenovorans]GCL71133.1 tripartite tricarboxylate transporter TctB family protein [Paenibacillus naphthalenovorans]SDI02689.1 Tripartite tricarboxylate transporter TctB family protein [Paenibacillus naphthalenovorans]
MKNLGVYMAVFFLLYSGIMFWESLSMDYYSEYGPGPGMLPRWVSGLTFVFSIIYLVISLKKDIILFSRILPKGEGLINVLVCAGSFILFIIIAPLLGFLIGSTITLFLLFMRGYKWYWSLGLSASISFIVFWVFGILLQVPLPVNDLGW